MKYLSLADLKRLPDSVLINQPGPGYFRQVLNGISIDSRTTEPNKVFWALKGPRFDGHDFVIDAIHKGVLAAVVEKKYAKRYEGLGIPIILVRDTLSALQKLAAIHRRKFKIPVVAITGSNGKTTTKEMIAWILQTKMKVHKTVGNLNNHIGTPLTLLSLTSEHDVAVIELATNKPGEIALLSSMVKPTSGLITNIGRAHLEFFSSLEGVSREKLELFNSIPKQGSIFLNKDDPHLPRYQSRRKTLWSYSLYGEKEAKVRGQLLDLNLNGQGTWRLNNRTLISLKVPGIHNVVNALAASTVALSFGIRPKYIKEALEAYTTYEKRMQIIKNGNVTFINDTYNANPDSFIPALKTLNHIARQKESRKIVVIGDMLELGLNSDTLHQELIFNLLDYDIDGIFTLGKACELAANMLREKGYVNVFSYKSHEILAKNLKKYLKSNDIVLVKGSRGMQMEKVFAYL